MSSLSLRLPDGGLNLVAEIPAEQAPALPLLFAIVLEHTVIDTGILSFHAQDRFRFLGLDDLKVGSALGGRMKKLTVADASWIPGLRQHFRRS